MITRTHNAYHLGDNLVHLHFLRKVALANPDRKFVHASQSQHTYQLRPLIADVPNITLEEYTHHTPSSSIDSWRGANQFWYSHPDRNDFVAFHLEWFEILARKMEVENPIKNAVQMLFDYKALEWEIQNNQSGFLAGVEVGTGVLFPRGDMGRPKNTTADDHQRFNAEYAREVASGNLPRFDVLLINSAPMSGQWLQYNAVLMSVLAEKLLSAGHRVISTSPLAGSDVHPHMVTSEFGLSVTKIGGLSACCNTIVMVSTGPSWPTFNIWNQQSIRRRIILLDSERVNLAPNTVHCRTIAQAEAQLKEDGLI